MKKILKKLSCALLAAAMVCAMTPLAASAAINYSKTRIVYMPTSGKRTWDTMRSRSAIFLLNRTFSNPMLK